MPVFDSIHELYSITRWRGYYGGIRLLQALIVRLIDSCDENGFSLDHRNFTIEYESNIPLRLGMGASLSEETEVFHSNVRERWRSGDRNVVQAMEIWASYAEQGRDALLRTRMYQISEGNLEMIRTARRLGATANFAGSGGAIIGTYKDEAMFDHLRETMRGIGVAVIKPIVLPTK
jgi:hypothetical protein